jgi:hypothetical protein
MFSRKPLLEMNLGRYVRWNDGGFPEVPIALPSPRNNRAATTTVET